METDRSRPELYCSVRKYIRLGHIQDQNIFRKGLNSAPSGK